MRPRQCSRRSITDWHEALLNDGYCSIYLVRGALCAAAPGEVIVNVATIVGARPLRDVGTPGRCVSRPPRSPQRVRVSHRIPLKGTTFALFPVIRKTRPTSFPHHGSFPLLRRPWRPI